jgi:hypothetical protein
MEGVLAVATIASLLATRVPGRHAARPAGAGSPCARATQCSCGLYPARAYLALAGGTIPFMRRYSTICP